MLLFAINTVSTETDQAKAHTLDLFTTKCLSQQPCATSSADSSSSPRRGTLRPVLPPAPVGKPRGPGDRGCYALQTLREGQRLLRLPRDLAFEVELHCAPRQVEARVERSGELQRRFLKRWPLFWAPGG